MKAKKAAILMVSAALAMGTIGAVSTLASPPAMSNEQPGEMPREQGFNGEVPQAPNGQDFNGEAPQAPNGQDFNGEVPQAPNGQDFNGEAPQTPDGATSQTPGMQPFEGEAPQAPNGQPSNGQEAQAPAGQEAQAQAPAGQSSNTPSQHGRMSKGKHGNRQKQGNENVVKVTAIENGSATVESRELSEPAGKPGQTASNSTGTPDDKAGTKTKNYDFSSAEIVKDSQGKREAASLSDISSGSMVELELNEDGSVKTVVIKEKPDRQVPNGQAPKNAAPQAPQGSQGTAGNEQSAA